MNHLKVIHLDEVMQVITTTITQKYQLSLTNPRNALHHGKRAANKGGRSL